MKKHISILWCVVFFLFFVAPQVIYGVVGGSNSINTENREMAKFPELNRWTINVFPERFDIYYNDALPFRSDLIRWNSYFNYFVFRESSVPMIVIGNEDWLFYNPNGTDGDNIADLNGEYLLSDEELERMLEQLLLAETKLREQGKEFIVMIAPNKESIYGNKFLPSAYINGNDYTTADQVVEYLRANSDLRIVYPKDELLNVIEKYPEYAVYYNTDTHWNYLGGYIGAKELVEELGGNMEEVSPQNIVYNEIVPKGTDLAFMLNMGDIIQEKNLYSVKSTTDVEILSPEIDILRQIDIPTELRFSTTSENDKKLFLVRDSFGTAMAEYIALNYKESVMVHRDIYDPAMILSEDPDIVVIEVVERYVRSLVEFTINID